MKGNRRWLGWLAIGLGAVALVVALAGRGFGSPIAAAGIRGAGVAQSSAQPGAGPQAGQNVPSAGKSRGSASQNAGPQIGGTAPGANQSGGAGSQGGQSSFGGEGRRGAGQPQGGSGLGGWFHFPIKLLSGALQMGLLALLVIAGLWLLRGRAPAGTVTTAPASGPPSEPESPTGESYVDEEGNRT